MKEEIHIGKHIRKKLKEDGRTIVWLADKLHYNRDNIYKFLKKPSINTNLLLHISKILEHDFFRYFSKHLKIK